MYLQSGHDRRYQVLLLCSVKKLIKVGSFRPGWNLGDNCAHLKPLGFKLSNYNLRQDGDFLPLGGLVLFFWVFTIFYIILNHIF